MYKVRINVATLLPVIENGKEAIRKCFPREDVYVSELNPQDIKNKVYRPYAAQVLSSDGKTPAAEVVRKRPVVAPTQPVTETDSVLNEVHQLRDEMKDIVGEFKGIVGQLKQPTQAPVTPVPVSQPEPQPEAPAPAAASIEKMPQTSIILPGMNPDIPAESFIQPDEENPDVYTAEDYTNFHNRIRRMIPNNIIDEDHDIQRMTTSTPRLPKFAGTGMKNIEGEIEIAKQGVGSGEGIVTMTPVEKSNMRVIKDSRGRMDIFAMLGAKVRTKDLI